MAHACVDAKEFQMQRSFLPFLFQPSPAASRLLGRRAPNAALLALKAILAHNRSLEVAHQQIRYAGRDFAFSSRVTAGGELVVDLDIGDPNLDGRIVLEEEFRAASRVVRGIAQEHRRSKVPRR
jgi:hypothetical protein